MKWPLYKRGLLTLGNPKSNTGLCTLWTEKEKVLERVNPKNYLIAGQCYSPDEGINLILRNSLANKRLRRIVLCGVDLTNCGEAILALKERGLDSDRKIVGFPESGIEPEIPLDAIERFRQNVDIIDYRRNRRDGTTSFDELNDILSQYETSEAWGDEEVYPRSEPIAPPFYPSERTGITVRGKTVGETWLKILDAILKFGYVKKSQYGDDQQELVDLTCIVSDENPTNIQWEKYFQFTRKELERYYPQLMSANIIGDVAYTYGSRLRNFRGIDQIKSMIEQLKEALYSRRAVGVTWDVKVDYNNPHCPCIDLVQALVQDRLHFTVYIRSNDMFRAWPQNAFGLRKMQYEICNGVGVKPGDLIIVSNSAHIYSSNWQDAQRLLRKNPIKPRKDPDPRGNLLIELENSRIKLTHLDPDGRRIGEFYADNAQMAYRHIAQSQMISQIGHALDIGVELGKAEIALREHRRYVQDKPL